MSNRIPARADSTHIVNHELLGRNTQRQIILDAGLFAAEQMRHPWSSSEILSFESCFEQMKAL